LLVAFSANAAVSLDRTIKADGKTISFEKIPAMIAGSEGTLLIVDSEKGVMTEFKGKAGVKYKLSGKDKAFDSESIKGLARKDAESLIVTNTSDNSVAIIGLDGKVIKKFVLDGSDEGQLSGPAGVAWSNNRRMYIADKGNGRISVFGNDGVFIKTIGKKGAKEGEALEEPVQVFVDPRERVYVLETRDEGIVSIFSHDGALLKRLTSEKIKAITGSTPELAAMAIDNTGLIYLADNHHGRVYQIDWQLGKMVSSFGSQGEQRGQFQKITSIAPLAGGQLAVADSENKKIEIYRLPATGRKALVQRRLPTVGFERTIKVQCSASYRLQGGNVLCLDNDAGKVGVFSSSGKLAKQFEGAFENPVAASVDDQNVVILDGESIKIYKLDGKLRYQAGASGSSEGQLDSPKGIFLHKDKIYVADTGNQRIQIFSKDGIFLEHISNPEQGESIFDDPSQVLVDGNNNLFVLEKSKKQILVFSANHKLLYKIGGVEGGANNFEQIFDIAIDNDENLYILCATETNKAHVQVYSGPTRVISIGSSTDNRAGMSEPVTLSIAPARKTVVSVYDAEKRALLNYKYMQLPAKLGGLVINGSTKQTRLSWERVPGSYISRYKVYASREEAGPFKYLTDVDGLEAVVKHKSAFTNRFYQVSAVSGFSVEGKASNIREDAFQAGYAYYRDMKYVKAEEIFGESYEQDKKNGEVLKYLGLSAMELGKTEDAVAYFRELSMLEGYQVEGMNLQVKALVGVKDYVGAKAVIDKVIADNTATVDTIVYCGELSLIMGDAIGAVTCLEEALQVDDKNIKAHFLIGKAYVRLGIPDKGLAEFEIAVSIDPENAEVWYQSGVVYQEMGKHDSAVISLTKALELKPDYGEAQLALARSHLELKQYDQVRNIAIKLAGKKETAAEGQYLLGITALATDQHGQALLALNKSTRADPTNAAAWLALVDVYIKMNQNTKVRGALVSAVEGDKSSFEAAYRLGVLDFEAGQYAEAAASLEIASNLKPDNYDARFKLADAQLRSGAYNQAAANAAIATKLKPDSPWPLALQANIANKQGKNGKAIDFVKQAMAIEKNSALLHTKLGSFYVENSMFDQAKGTLEKAALLDATSAAPYVLLGGLYSQRRLFDESIAAYDQAVKLDPSAENKLALDTAYAEKKKSLEFKSNAPQIVLKDLRIDQVFSAAYKQYASDPVGFVKVQNTSAQDYGNLKLTFTIKGYMDFPATTEIPMLKANGVEEIPLRATFNNKILEIDEDTGVQVEVAVNFIRDGRNDSINVTQPMTIYGKNAIVWGRTNMVGSFVTPKDDTLRDFVRTALNENKPKAKAIDRSLLTAMTLFDVLTAHGIQYVVDPNAPYSSVSETSVDYVQFSRETLKIKSGDCDDLSVLMSTGLENMGIETAILDVPGHLLMMFNTGLPESERQLISLDDDLLVVHEGTVWIPVEATMVGTTFAEAWAEGARKYHDHLAKSELKVIPLKTAWEEYKPVTLKPAGYTLKVPEKTHVSPIVDREKKLLLEKSLDRLVRPYRAMVSVDPSNIKARMQVAIIFAKNGLYEAADKEFEEILSVEPKNSAVFNNRGNIYFSKTDYERAIESYSYAEKLAANDAGVKMNLSMAHYKMGDLQLASAKYEEAAMIDNGVGKKYAGFIKLLSN
jgi:tetratricopeptide (TPR) repeat protein